VTRVLTLLALVAILTVPSARGGEILDAVVVLEAADGLPGSVPSAAPPRFVLGRDRQVFVGGSEKIYSGLLDKDEMKAIEDRVKTLAKSGLLDAPVSFGADTEKRYRLRLPREGDRDVVITGDPASAPPALLGLAALVTDLLRFDHPNLRPWAPAEYAVSAREGELAGGCRSWLLELPFDRVLAGPQRIPAAEVERWPAGSDPASVCEAGRRYVVTFRPLLPGEQP
jgi:hypothetical protein